MNEPKIDQAPASSTQAEEGSDKEIAKGRLVIKVRSALNAGFYCTSGGDCTSKCNCMSRGCMMKIQ